MNGKCVQAIPCPAGQYATVQATATSERVCEPCPAGSYTNLSNTLSGCLPCPSGTIQTQTGQTSCGTCTDGFYRISSSVEGACPAGSYCKSCIVTPCPIGQFQDQTQQSTCTDCPSGLIQPLGGQTTCTDCSTGFYRVSTTTQVSCEVGYRCPGQCSRLICTPGISSLHNMA